MNDILRYFPLHEPRAKQVNACKYIQSKVEAGFADIVIAAPTGVGKSAIGVCAGMWIASHAPPKSCAPGAYYLVTQKLLQDQITDDIVKYTPECRDCASIKSAEEYPCEEFVDCGAGIRLAGVASRIGALSPEKKATMSPDALERRTRKCRCLENGTCAYRMAKARWQAAKLSVTNYAYFLTSKLYTLDLKPRQMLILDECHTLEDQIIRFVDGAVSLAQVKKWTGKTTIPSFDTIDNYLDWIEHKYVPDLTVIFNGMLDIEVLAEGDGEKASKEITELDKYICKLVRAIDQLKLNKDNWVFWKEESKDGQDVQYVVRPVFGAPFVPEFIKSMAPIRLHLSAYPGVPGVYCRNLGLNPKEVAWAGMGSDFPLQNRRVHYWPMGSMGSKSKVATTPTLLKSVIKIANKHSDRGLIHCNSYELGDAIEAALRTSGHADRVIFPKNSDDREEAFKLHAVTEGAILISPSMTEGFDFCGDRARWQIIPKCVDKCTRIFTKRGLIKFSDVVIGDVTWGLTPDGKMAETHVQAVIARNYSGKLLHFTSQSLDMALTPDHRIFGKNLKQRYFSYVEAASVHAKNHWIPRTVPSVNFAEDEIINLSAWSAPEDFITATGYWSNKKCRKRSPLKFSKLDLFEFIGWYMSEGHVDHTHELGAIFLTQVKHDGIAKITALLKKLGVHFTFHAGKTFDIRSGILRRFLNKECTHYSHLKSVSRWILDQQPQFLKALWLGEMYGDGSFCKTSTGCSTVSKLWADQLLEIGVKIGYSPVLSVSQKENRRTSYGLSFHTGRYASPGKSKRAEIDYDDIVYCVTTDLGHFLAERFGKTFFTGNCPFPYLGDKQVARKLELDEEWYIMKTVMTVIQASGRICRSSADYGVTYILDSDFKALMDKAAYMLPAWYKDAIVFH